MRKLVSVLLCCLIVAGVLATGFTTYAFSISQSQAASWVKTQGDNKAGFDIDGKYGCQCTDFVSAYMNYLVDGDPYSRRYSTKNAYDYDIFASNDPSRWELIYNTVSFLPQPGDIFVSEYGEYGHVGVVVSSDTAHAWVVDQNYVNSNWVTGSPCCYHYITWVGNNKGAYGANWFIRYRGYQAESFTFDVNVVLDGARNDNGISGLTFDVYINGKKSAEDCTDFCTPYPRGTTYEVKDFRTTGALIYNGNSSYSGTINGTTEVLLKVSTGLTVRSETIEKYRMTIPANYSFPIYDSATATTKKWTALSQDSSYTFTCNARYQLSDGSVRYRYTTSDGAYRYFTYTSSMSVSVADTTSPTGSLSSTNNVAASQKVTLTLKDNAGIAGYYWGISSSYSNNTYYSVSGSPKSTTDTQTVTAAGTYYLTVRDTGGNLSSQVSKTFYLTTLNGNGVTASPSYVITPAGSSFTLPSLTRSNYSFKGWNTASDGSGTSRTGSYTPSGYSLLYAQWTGNSYTVSYNANGGQGAPASQTKRYGETLTLSSTVPTRSGYRFNGWNTKSDGTGTKYSASASYTQNAAVTLYAQWVAITYTVSYNANGGQGAPASQTKHYGETLTLSSTVPTKSGYRFNGWNTKSDGTGTGYTAFASYTQNASVTLYAQWKTATYGVLYETNDGGEMPIFTTATKTHGVDLPIIASHPEREGYTFAGWNTRPDGSGKAYVYGDFYRDNQNVTLYARWKPLSSPSEEPGSSEIASPSSSSFSLLSWLEALISFILNLFLMFR